MNLTLDDLIAANANGSLESLLLGYGMFPLDVLKYVLDEVTPHIQKLESEITVLEDNLDSYIYE